MNHDEYARQYPPFPIIDNLAPIGDRNSRSSTRVLRCLLPYPRRRRQRSHQEPRRGTVSLCSGAAVPQPDTPQLQQHGISS